MKTAQDILAAIEKGKKEEKESALNHAIELIEKTSEKMVEYKRTHEFVADSSDKQLVAAAKFPELQEFVKKNGFILEERYGYFYLRVNPYPDAE